MTTADFAGKVAVITGGASGIGKACAVALARGGARVVIADLDEEASARAVTNISESGGEAAAFRVDVTVPQEVEAMVAFAVERFGGLDLAVNNAGINGQSAPIGEYSLESWHRVIDVDLNGLFYSLRYEIPAMLERGGGSIVNLSSVLGTVGATNLSAYIAAKHGVNGLTKAAALDYARKGIRVNCVAPSFVETPLLGELGKVTRAAFSQMQPMRRIGQPEEVASLVTFLLSDAAAYITGSVYAIDGGYTTP